MRQAHVRLHRRLALFREHFPNAPPLDIQDVKNILKTPGGSKDAHVLFNMLRAKQRVDDPAWYDNYKNDSYERLSHLFYMSSSMRDRAADLYHIVIHDINTYKSNRLDLPLGVFTIVNKCTPYHIDMVCL